MLRAAVFGAPGSGSTTVLGLLYAAQVRLGTERTDPFRFFSPPNSLATLSTIYLRLMTGTFPETPTAEEVASVRMEFSYRRPTGVLDRWRRPTDFADQPEIDCRWVRSEFGILGQFLAGSGSAGPFAPELVQCTVPIFVLPAEPPRPVDGATAPAVPSADEGVWTILERLRDSAADGGRGPGPTHHPVVIFTMLDRMSGTSLRSIGADPALEEAGLLRDRQRIGAALLRARLPRTTADLHAATRTDPTPEVFLSYVRTDPAESGTTSRLQMRAEPGHRPEPVYPWTQYRALLEHLGSLAASSAGS